jgi:lysophospholipase L1-like esterase
MSKVPPYVEYVTRNTLATILALAPSSYTNKKAFATDAGISGSEFISDGKAWKPYQPELFAPMTQIATALVAGSPTITDLNSSTSTISPNQRITKDNACFKYLCNNPGIWAANSNYIIPRNAADTADASNYMSVTFATDAPVFELYLNRFNTRVMIFVDEQPALTNAIALDTAGSVDLISVDFAGVRKVRNIRVSGYNFPFGGLYIGQYDSVYPVVDFRPVVVVFGDSYTQGTGANAQDVTWAGTFSRVLDCQYWLDGIGGAGYGSTSTSATDYRMQNRMNLLQQRVGGVNSAVVPNAVVWAMGCNDAFGGKTRAQVEAGFDAGYTAATYKPTHVLGCFTPNLATTATALANVSSWLQARAATVSARFIVTAGIVDAINKGVLTGGDAVHPTQVGHDYIGYRVARKVKYAES